LLFWKKLRGLPIDRADKDRHRKASYLSVILLLLHLSESVQNWQSILLVSFVLTAISAFFARAVMKPNSRAAVFWQVFFHTLFGAVTFAAALPHSIIGLVFE